MGNTRTGHPTHPRNPPLPPPAPTAHNPADPTDPADFTDLAAAVRTLLALRPDLAQTTRTPPPAPLKPPGSPEPLNGPDHPWPRTWNSRPSSV